MVGSVLWGALCIGNRGPQKRRSDHDRSNFPSSGLELRMYGNDHHYAECRHPLTLKSRDTPRKRTEIKRGWVVPLSLAPSQSLRGLDWWERADTLNASLSTPHPVHALKRFDLLVSASTPHCVTGASLGCHRKKPPPPIWSPTIKRIVLALYSLRKNYKAITL